MPGNFFCAYRLGKAHLDLVTGVGITLEMLNSAASAADELADILGDTNDERDTVSEVMIIRDKAYTFLKGLVDEIRECGKFVFWRNPDRMKGYVSEYHKH